MALDAEYFDAIYIDVVKKKYYNANKVRAVFEDIRRQAEELNEENYRLRQELAGMQDRRVELGDALLSAQSIYREIVEKAKARADELIAAAEQRAAAIERDARERSEEILADSNRQQEYAVQRVEGAFNRMKQLHMASIDALNAEWQDFLCGLYPEQELPKAPQQSKASPRGDTELPPDLEEKVSAIAEKLFALDQDN